MENEKINHPAHYMSNPSGIECIDVAEHFCFNLGNVIKYMWRADEKGAPLDDLKKASWYINREIEKREKECLKTKKRGRRTAKKPRTLQTQ